MKKFLFVLAVTSGLLFATEHKVVFDLTSGDATTVSKRLVTNVSLLKEHYAQQGDTLSIAVVISGDAYKFFVQDIEHSPYAQLKGTRESNSMLQEKIQVLVKDGTRFEVCSVGLKKRGITQKSLYGYVRPAFNKTAALIEFQNEGYAYIPLN